MLLSESSFDDWKRGAWTQSPMEWRGGAGLFQPGPKHNWHDGGSRGMFKTPLLLRPRKGLVGSNGDWGQIHAPVIKAKANVLCIRGTR